MNWLISANGQMYDHYESFKANGYIDWHQTANFSIGDVVYIYCTRPHKLIRFKTVVVDIDMDFKDATDDRIFWKDLSYYNKAKNDKFCRLRLLEEFYNENLILDKLKENGLNAAPQGAQKIQPRLEKYLERILGENSSTLLGQDSSKFAEGTKVLKQHISRERNPKLVEQAKAKFKAQNNGRLFCEVCGFDFTLKYGKLGDGFIEAHHIKPISKMKEGELTSVDDIAMLCSNCHSMVHRRNPLIETRKDLKKILK